MSTLARSLVTWKEFLRLPERPEGSQRYELQDGEVVIGLPARTLQIKLQKRIERLLEALAGERGVVTIEFPYRPVINLQFWFADVAYVPKLAWDALPPGDYPIYSPPLIVEVLSPSNTPARVSRQRIVAMSVGTAEFWVVDPENRTVFVTDLKGARVYASADTIPLTILGGSTIAVDDIFTL